MAPPTDHRRERSSTYIVQDRSNQEELKRLQLQDEMITIAMGGLLPKQPDPTRFQCVLDMACGTGGWLIEAAKTYPTITKLVGADISRRVLDYAHMQAEARQVNDRVEFYEMDALRVFEFPKDFFDLVNLRLGASFLRVWEWPRLLKEFQRVTQPGGVIRVTDVDLPNQTSSPALLRLLCLLGRAFGQAGNYFSTEANGVADELAGLLDWHGLQDVQTRVCTLEVSAGTVIGQLYFEDMKYLFRTTLPFMRKWTRVPDDYEDIYQQMLHEMQQPDFVVAGHITTAWGINK
jgi:ubiquinone/menaquinone biosynthesis C-methylase UbiE